jgi:hypothetical protein
MKFKSSGEVSLRLVVLPACSGCVHCATATLLGRGDVSIPPPSVRELPPGTFSAMLTRKKRPNEQKLALYLFPLLDL